MQGDTIVLPMPRLKTRKSKSIHDAVSQIQRWQAALDKPVWINITPKIDGLNIACEYEVSDGWATLTRVTTRGNGRVGRDISSVAKCIAGLRPELPYASAPDGHKFSVVGEAFSTEFPQAKVSGVLRRTTPPCPDVYLNWFAFATDDGGDRSWDTELDFVPSLAQIASSSGALEISSALLQSLREARGLGLPVDHDVEGGSSVVVRIADDADREALQTSDYPTYAAGIVALKFDGAKYAEGIGE